MAAVEYGTIKNAATLLQTGYFLLVATSYRAADMSQVYPVMRGTAPLIVTAFSVAVLEAAEGDAGREQGEDEPLLPARVLLPTMPEMADPT